MGYPSRLSDGMIGRTGGMGGRTDGWTAEQANRASERLDRWM
jgi:hypothetical protein